MEILTGAWTNIAELTVGGVSLIVITNALTQAIKGAIPLDHKWIPYPVGVILTLIGLGFTFEAVLTGIVVGFLASGVYNALAK